MTATLKKEDVSLAIHESVHLKQNQSIKTGAYDTKVFIIY